jgi:hypothetical protein
MSCSHLLPAHEKCLGLRTGSMSERDLRRIEGLSDVRAGRRTVAAAAAVLAVSERQGNRLLARYEVDGGSGLIHKARGRPSNRSRNEGIRTYAVELVKARYADSGRRWRPKCCWRRISFKSAGRPCGDG